MLRNLLAERFRLAVHHESREMPTFRLVVAPGGPALKAHVEGVPAARVDKTKPINGAAGIAYRVQGKTIAEFAKVVEGQLRRPVTDATNVAGKYDFDLWWSTEDLAADAASAPSDALTLRTAIQSLGLKLETQKRPARRDRGRSCGQAAFRELISPEAERRCAASWGTMCRLLSSNLQRDAAAVPGHGQSTITPFFCRLSERNLFIPRPSAGSKMVFL